MPRQVKSNRIDNLSPNLIYLHIFPYLKVNQSHQELFAQRENGSNDVDTMIKLLFFLSVCVLSLIDISFIGCYNTSFGSYHWAYYLYISNRFIMRASFNTQKLIYLFYIVIEVWSERVWDWLTILQLNWTSDSIVHWPNRLMWFFFAN